MKGYHNKETIGLFDKASVSANERDIWSIEAKGSLAREGLMDSSNTSENAVAKGFRCRYLRLSEGQGDVETVVFGVVSIYNRK